MDKYIVSARKYRPSTFATVVGQSALTSTLKNAIATDRLAHAYLFCGSRGVGKTSCARIFAKAINCEHRTPDGEPCNECESCRAFNAGSSLNIVELDAASNNSVDDIRNLNDQVRVAPTSGRYRVFIIDEVHMLSSGAFNAFLKTLEEPPSYVVFILATTEKHKIIPTILSRCQIYDFNRITINDMVNHLEHVAQQEGITTERSALGVIASKADGAMRDALSIFDQIAASSRGNITYKSTIDNLNVLDVNYFSKLVDAFLAGDVPAALLTYKEIRDHGFDSHAFITGLAAYIRDLMVVREESTRSLVDTDPETLALMATQAAKCTPTFLYQAMSLCNDADLNYRQATAKTFLVELLLIKLCQLLSPSPIFSGDGEGQLKPLKASATPAPAAASAAPQRPGTPAVNVAPQPTASQPVRPTSGAPTPGITPPPQPPRPMNGGFIPTAPPTTPQHGSRPTPHVLSIRGNNRAEQAEVMAAPAAQHRNAKYDPQAILEAWNEFREKDPTQRILYNTMRASVPVVRQGQLHSYDVTVENSTQLEKLQEAMPALLEYVHERLANDNVTFNVQLNQGEASPTTYDDRRAMQYLAQKYPNVDKMIMRLELNLI